MFKGTRKVIFTNANNLHIAEHYQLSVLGKLLVVQQDDLVFSLFAPLFCRYLGVSCFYPKLPFLFRSW